MINMAGRANHETSHCATSSAARQAATGVCCELMTVRMSNNTCSPGLASTVVANPQRINQACA